MVPRLSLLIVGIIVAYSALLFTLYDLQVRQGEEFIGQAGLQSTGILPGPRGSIYFTDRNGNPLQVATNKHFARIFAVPRDLEDPLEAAHRVAEALERPVGDFRERFQKENDAYELIEQKASNLHVERVRELDMQGIHVQLFPERFYPFSTLGAHLLGYVGPSKTEITEVGHYGIEAFHENILTGQAGEIRDGKIIPSRSGEDVYLTIDANIQIEAERVLDDVVREYRASGGSVLVLDPATGRILAMGSLPNFDPNSYAESPIGDFLNPVTQKIYEPGSVFKVLTMAAGVDSGAITPQTTYRDSGTVTVSGRTISNWDFTTHGAYGTVTMTNVLEHSLNTGAIYAEQQIGHAAFTKYLHAFGLGERTGADVPGELAGDLRQLHDNAPTVAFATASFGQGVAVTALELANAVAAIANDGVLMRPFVHADSSPQVIRRVISSDAAQEVSAMMVSAVDKAGVAAIKGYAVAGKTGTAFIPDFTYGGYTDNVINTYVGFAPATDPRFVILIKLDTPEGAPGAGLTVVPAFRDLAQFIINYYSIPPDRLLHP